MIVAVLPTVDEGRGNDMLVCACSRAGTSQCTRCMYSDLHLGDVPGLPKIDPQYEVYRLKELLYIIREIAVVDFNSTYERLASKGFDDNFRIPESRFNEILSGL